MNTNQKFAAHLVQGIDQQEPPTPLSASLIENYTVDPATKGWDNRLGYEKYLSSRAKYGILGELDQIRSLYIWTQHNGAQQYVIYESEGNLCLLDPANNRCELIDGERTRYANNDIGTFYVPFGPYLIILNGEDRPIKFRGWPSNRDNANSASWSSYLGFQRTPEAPSAWRITTDSSVEDISYGRTCSIFATKLDTEDDYSERGLGSSTGNETNSYQWLVTQVSDSGSESPISHPSNTIEWTTPNADTYNEYRFIGQVDIPTGEYPHVAARRLYRSKSNDFTGFYFVAQVDNPEEPLFYDAVGDTELSSLAPSVTDSVPFPCPGTRFGAAFKGCLFLEGGASQSTTLFYSNPGKPDQYGALNFLELGSRTGGSITGLHAYYDLLLVLRERSVDVVTGDYSNGFVSTTLMEGVGSRSPKAIVTVPELNGVMFLGTDGVYLYRGSLDGGSKIGLERISDPIMKSVGTFTREALGRAVAVYSSKWREVHFYVPTAGAPKPNLGLVFHTDKLAWSLRKDFPVGSVSVDAKGDIIFGHKTGASNDYQESGLFAVSRIRQQGYGFQADGEGGYVPANNPPYNSVFRSPMLDFGDASRKKFVKYVYLMVKTFGGDNSIQLRYRLDHSYEYTSTTDRKLQRPDHPDQAVYDKAVYGTDAWQEGFLTELRFPVPNKACSYFQWELVTSNDIVLIGYHIDYSIQGMIVGDGKEVPTTRRRA